MKRFNQKKRDSNQQSGKDARKRNFGWGEFGSVKIVNGLLITVASTLTLLFLDPGIKLAGWCTIGIVIGVCFLISGLVGEQGVW